MTIKDLNQMRTTGMDTAVDAYSVDTAQLDDSLQKEYKYTNPEFPQYLGYYKKIPELKQAIDSLARWVTGKGYKTDTRTEVELENITGWGEDSFDSILRNMFVMMKVNGDSFAEIIRNDKGTLVNLKPLNPFRVAIVSNKKGMILRYEEYDPVSKSIKRNYEPNEIFHLCNNRVASEVHGTSIIESVKWIIDSRNEAMQTWRRILQRSGLRVVYVDTQDDTLLAKVKSEWGTAVDKGEALIVPGKRGEVEILDFPVAPIQPYLETIRYYESFFQKAVGVPGVILGGAAEYTEASSKVGYLTFEQVYMSEQRELEKDLWNQLAIKLTFERPVSIKEPVVNSEKANTGQVGFQPNELNVGVNRTE